MQEVPMLLLWLIEAAYAQSDVAEDLFQAAQTTLMRLVGGLVVGLVLINVLLAWVRRRARAEEDEVEEQSKPLEERRSLSPRLADLVRPRRQVDLASCCAAQPDFAVQEVLAKVQDFFRQVQESRARGPGAALRARMTDGALETALAGPTGLQAVGRVRFARTQLVRAFAPEGVPQIQVRLLALVEETRADKASTWEVEETWRLVAARVEGGWRLVHIDRALRQPLPLPHAEWNKPVVEHEATQVDPELELQKKSLQERMPGFDQDAFFSGVKGCFARVQAAISHQTPEAVSNLLSPLALEEVLTWQRRYHLAGLARRRTEVEVTRVEWVQALPDAVSDRITCRLRGSLKDVVENPEGEPVPGQRLNAVPFSEYWTFYRGSDGPWRVERFEMDADFLL